MEPDLIMKLTLGIIGVLLIRMIDKMEKSIGRLTASAEQLNVKLAIVCERVDTHDKRITRLEKQDFNVGLMKAAQRAET